jgi:hypothetical protein
MDALTTALLLGKTEIRTRGYRPAPFRNWKLDDEEGIAIVRFGPFDGPATFDHCAIFDADQPMIVVPEASTVSIPIGWIWDWQLTIDVLSERLTHYEHC